MSRVVEVYSRAFYQRYIVNDSDTLFLTNLEIFLNQYNEKLKIFFESKNISANEKISTFREISTKLHYTPQMCEMVIYLLEKGRVAYFEEICENMFQLAKLASQVEEVEAIFAYMPTDIQLAEIQEIFEKKLKKKVELKVIIDRNIIGGSIIRSCDREYNGSLRYQLEKYRDQLN
ncbi:MAG: ATP synthase F1 subunit delta [Fusobacteria bacterium]|nr:ATP synthase F1 subunit delta [Fusobacteriota bacterium]